MVRRKEVNHMKSVAKDLLVLGYYYGILPGTVVAFLFDLLELQRA